MAFSNRLRISQHLLPCPRLLRVPNCYSPRHRHFLHFFQGFHFYHPSSRRSPYPVPFYQEWSRRRTQMQLEKLMKFLVKLLKFSIISPLFKNAENFYVVASWEKQIPLGFCDLPSLSEEMFTIADERVRSTTQVDDLLCIGGIDDCL